MSCGTNEQTNGDEKSEIFRKVYSTDNIKTQHFQIDTKRNNTIVGKSGTTIHIPKNCFTDKSGKSIVGKVEIELKEALEPFDWVIGNLTTVYGGKPLESGGMIYLNASANNDTLVIASGKAIEVSVPTDDFNENMSLFNGTITDHGIKWTNPVPLSTQKDSETNPSFETIKKDRITNVRFSVEGFENAYDAPKEVQDEVGRICWSGEGLKIRNDSTLQIEGYVVHFYKETDLHDTKETIVQKGVNSFIEDDATSYIFSLKKLGWANIDRLMDDARTEEVNLITSIENSTDFQFVYISLITKKMYLPGYKKKDGTYSFAHDDTEEQLLPVGETAIILATAYKEGKPFLHFEKSRSKRNKQSLAIWRKRP